MKPNSSNNKNEQLKTRHHSMWIEDGILFQTYNDSLHRITLKIAQEIVQQRLELCKGRSFPILTDSNKARILDDDARKFFSSAQSQASAFALVVRNPFSKLIGNFFVELEPIIIPAKLFTNFDQGVLWLNQFKLP